VSAVGWVPPGCQHAKLSSCLAPTCHLPRWPLGGRATRYFRRPVLCTQLGRSFRNPHPIRIPSNNPGPSHCGSGLWDARSVAHPFGFPPLGRNCDLDDQPPGLRALGCLCWTSPGRWPPPAYVSCSRREQRDERSVAHSLRCLSQECALHVTTAACGLQSAARTIFRSREDDRRSEAALLLRSSCEK